MNTPPVGPTGAPLCEDCPNTFLCYLLYERCYECPTCKRRYLR